MHGGYARSTGVACGRLGLRGDQRNLGCSLEYVGVECAQMNLGVSGLRRCRVHVVCYSGES